MAPRWFVVGLVACLIGCGEGPASLWSTAQFEEQQHNPAHARELYEQIVRDHPGTPEAAKASERLQALD